MQTSHCSSGYRPSKAFDSAAHPLLLAKFNAYGFMYDAVEIMTTYLIRRGQRAKLDGEHST